MTLKKQLITLLLSLFFLLFIGTFSVSLRNSYRFIGEQLSSHAQDTATSLGLSLSQVIQEGDETLLARMVDAIFDSGYYKTIIVSKTDGTPIITRKQEIKVYGVPNWFINFIPLNTPEKTAEIMTAWTRAGSVKVTSNPGYAYADLWQSSKDTFWLYLGTSLLAIGIGLFILHFILKPLKAISAQAEAICHREFPVLKSLPFTNDLRTVVKAMNRLSQKVRIMFEEEAARTEQYRKDAFSDLVTGLGNRRFLMQEINYVLRGGRDIAQGALAHIEVFNFKAYNDRWGFEAGNQLLNQIASTLKVQTSRYKDVVLAKMQGGGFTILVPHVVKEQIEELLKNISDEFTEYKARGVTDIDDVAHLGGAIFHQGDLTKTLLADADHALRSAQTKGENAYELFEETKSSAHGLGLTDWSSLLNKVVLTNDVLAYYQPAYIFNKKTSMNFLHHEALLRIHSDTNELLIAGAFWPMAERLNLTHNLDFMALKLVLSDLYKKPKENFSLNFSLKSLKEETFVHDVYELLQKNIKIIKRLSIELSEYNVVRNLELVKDFQERIRPLGVSLIIDHFGQQFDSVLYLKTLKPDYIKIDGAFIHKLDENIHNQQYIASIAKMSHGLDIIVIAERVETQEICDLLFKLGVDGAQGFHLGKPGPLSMS